MRLFDEHIERAREYFIKDFGREPNEKELLDYYRLVFRFYWD